MSMYPPTLQMADLPAEIPLFPLSGVVLVPGARLPLSIFEPRYLNMIDDAMAHDRLIGIIQPRTNHSDPVPQDAPVYGIGGLGYLVDELPDDEDPNPAPPGPGPRMITLEGVVRFELTREIKPLNGYRRGAVDYTVFGNDLAAHSQAVADRPRLVRAVEGFLKRGGLGPDLPADDITQICQGPADMLVAALTTLARFHTAEKQALLECPGLAQQALMLTGLLEMAIFERDAAGDGSGGTGNRH